MEQISKFAGFISKTLLIFAIALFGAFHPIDAAHVQTEEAFAATPFLHGLQYAQSTDPGYGGSDPGRGSEPSSGNNPTIGLNPQTTEKTTQAITSTVNACRRLPKVYRPDCLRQAFARASRASNGNSSYGEVRKHLHDAKKQMDKIIIPNIDKSKPVLSVNGQTYRPVTQSSLRQVNRAATKVVKETETKLLRSASNSKARKVHYAKVAQAVGSTKVLLRS